MGEATTSDVMKIRYLVRITENRFGKIEDSWKARSMHFLFNLLHLVLLFKE